MKPQTFCIFLNKNPSYIVAPPDRIATCISRGKILIETKNMKILKILTKEWQFLVENNGLFYLLKTHKYYI